MPSLHEHIERELEHGQRKETIYHQLLGQGHSIAAIDTAWKAVHARHSAWSGVSVMLVLGAVLVGVGVLSFVASNWDVMSKALRIMIILVAMVVSYGSGWTVLQRGHRATGHALLLLGSLIYGSGIMLVGQMYHVHTDWSSAFNLWLIGVLAITALFVSITHGVLACLIPIAGGVAFFFDTILRIFNEHGELYGDGSWITVVITALAAVALWLTAIYLRRVTTGVAANAAVVSITSGAKKWLGRIAQLLFVYAIGSTAQAGILALTLAGVGTTPTTRVVGGVMAAVGLAVAYWVRGRIVLFFALLNLITWWFGSLIASEASTRLVAGYSFLGLALLTLIALILAGIAHRLYPKFRHFGSIYMGPAITVLLITLIATSSSGAIMDIWGSYGAGGASVLTSWSMTFTYFVLIAIVCGLLLVLSRVRAFLRIELLGLAILAVFSLVVGTTALHVSTVSSGMLYVVDEPFSTTGIVWALVMNLVAFATMIWLAVVGYQRQHRWRVSTAAVAIIIWVLARYFDWIFTYLDKSIGFISLGLVLLVVGYALERGRKKIIASFTHHHSA